MTASDRVDAKETVDRIGAALDRLRSAEVHECVARDVKRRLRKIERDVYPATEARALMALADELELLATMKEAHHG